jgi:hypothetical protein
LAAASSTASGRPSSRATTAATASSGRLAPGRAASARRRNSSAAAASESWPSWYTCSAGDRQRRAAGRDDAQVARGGDEERDEVRDGLDEVLAVVEHEQRRRLVEVLRDAGPDVGPLLAGERAAADDRVADAEHRADLADDVLRRRDADQLHDVHDRTARRRAPAGARAGSCPSPPGPTIEVTRADRTVGAQRGDVVVPADELGGVVPDAGAHRPVGGQQLAVAALERGPGVGAEAVGERWRNAS